MTEADLNERPLQPPSDLCVGGRPAPLGIQTNPVFSWHSSVGKQTGYEVQVGHTPGTADIWSSGLIESSDSMGVSYRGPALQPSTVYYWRVRTRDAAGGFSAWADSSWETALFDEADWEGAAWIGGRQPQDHNWTDFEATVDFTGGRDAQGGLRFLFHAEPIGKTWAEAYEWVLGLAPRLDSRLSAPAASGATELTIEDCKGLSIGDEIFIGSDIAHSSRVRRVGHPSVERQVNASLEPGVIVVDTDMGIGVGEPLWIGRTKVMVERVIHTSGGTILFFDNSVAVTVGDVVSRSAAPTVIETPLPHAFEPGAPARGVARMQLAMATRHYAGNTGVPDGLPAVEWGVNRFDPQSETNPVEDGIRHVPIATLDVPLATHLTEHTWSDSHQLGVRVTGPVVQTTLNGIVIDQRELVGDQLRRSGSIGFGLGTSANINRVAIRSSEGRALDIDPSRGHNPFEGGVPGPSGLRVGSVAAMLPIANPAPLLRYRFPVPEQPLVRARLYVTAAGQHEFTIDGRELRVHVPALAGPPTTPRLLPDQTSFDSTVLYNTFDVTDYLVPGMEAVLAAELGRGWFGVTTATQWYWNQTAFNGAPRLLAKLVIDLADGERIVVTTGPGWQTIDGPVRFDSLYSGEKFDGRIADALQGWRTCQDQAAWSPATVMARPGHARGTDHHGALPAVTEPVGFTPARLRAAEHEPVVVLETLLPVDAFESFPGSGTWIVDFGKIITGFPRVALRGLTAGAEGATIRFRGGNVLFGEGSEASPWEVEHENDFLDADLQTHYFTVGSSADQEWIPTLTHWGFRFVEVHNLGLAMGELSPAVVSRAFSAQVARNGFARAASFRSDSPLLNRINTNLERAQQNNLLHKPTDTPSREKNGWSGDAMASSQAELIIWGVAAFFRKYLRDFPDALSSEGQLPMILPAPKGGFGYAKTPGWNFCWSAVPAWDAALFVMPWELYLYSGDPTMLAELFPTQRRMLQYYERLFLAESDYVFEAALGEYSAAGDAGSNAVISLQFYVYFVDYMVRVGNLLGESDVQHWEQLGGKLRRAFIRQYWNRASGAVTGGHPETANVMAVQFGLIPGSDLPVEDPLYLSEAGTQGVNRVSAAAAAASSIREHGYHAQMGIFGARYAFTVLEDYGYTDLLMKSVTAREAPSFADQISRGATSLWELWGGGSHNHHYRSSVATWFYQELGGIAPLTPGYGSVRIRPRVPVSEDYTRTVPSGPGDPGGSGPLTQVSVDIQTVRGMVACEWRRDPGGALELTVQVPANTQAEVWCPDANGNVEAPPELDFVGVREHGKVLYRVYTAGAGKHRLAGSVAAHGSSTSATERRSPIRS